MSFPSASGSFEGLIPLNTPSVGSFTSPANTFDAGFLSFVGATMELDLAYLEGSPTRFPGVRSSRFEGRIFLCFDPVSKTLLSAGQGDSHETLVAWRQAHPSAAKACGIVESPDVVTPAYIYSPVGAAVYFTQGDEPRVATATLWDPTVMP